MKQATKILSMEWCFQQRKLRPFCQSRPCTIHLSRGMGYTTLASETADGTGSANQVTSPAAASSVSACSQYSVRAGLSRQVLLRLTPSQIRL